MSQKSGSQFIAFLTVIVVTVTGLVLVLRNSRTAPSPMPETPRATSTFPIAQPVTKSKEQKSCEDVGGTWKECGSPCVERPEEVCIQVCQPQCLCGAKNSWRCPDELACVSIPSLGKAPKIAGVCRSRQASEQEKVEPR